MRHIFYFFAFILILTVGIKDSTAQRRKVQQPQQIEGTFLSGSFDESDWEELEILYTAKGLFVYYRYQKQRQASPLRLIVVDDRDEYMIVRFPNKKTYFITARDMDTLVMTDSSGTYRKVFKKIKAVG